MLELVKAEFVNKVHGQQLVSSGVKSLLNRYWLYKPLIVRKKRYIFPSAALTTQRYKPSYDKFPDQYR